MSSNWEEILRDRLKFYGHRNWIVIADSAYPAQSRQGIETIVADEEEQSAVLDRVFAILSACKHIKPKVYLDQEYRDSYPRKTPLASVRFGKSWIASLKKLTRAPFPKKRSSRCSIVPANCFESS
jgi:L-fucose mutarotase/ribose pyranase (RbsD/FucU family)